MPVTNNPQSSLPPSNRTPSLYQGSKPYGLTPKFWDYYQNVREKTIGYRPTFWEQPSQVARYHNMLRALRPDEAPPSWVDPNELATAYEYLKWRNQDRPYWMWNYLPADDPGREFLQGIKPPSPENWYSPTELEFVKANREKDLRVASRQREMVRQPEYQPTWWEDPRNVAWAYHAMNAQKPGEAPPKWLNAQQVNEAFAYFDARNGGKPYWEWDYLPAVDPGREFLQGIEPPPPYSPAAQEQLQQPDQAGLTEEQWANLPKWQQGILPVLQSPTGMGLLQSLPMAAIAGLSAGPLGAGIALGLGGGIGVLQEEGVAEVLAPLFDTNVETYQKTLSDAAYYLFNLPTEAAERALGVGAQLYASLKDPDKFGEAYEILAHLPEAWRAAHFTLEASPYELANVFPLITGEELAGPGEYWGPLGTVEGAQPIEEGGQFGLEGLVEMRRSFMEGDAKALIEANVPLDQVNLILAQQYGFSGQMREIIGQTVLGIVTEKAGQKAIRVGTKVSGNDLLIKAAELSNGRPMEMMQAYGILLRTQKSADEISKMGAVSRWLAGVTKTGESIQLDPKAAPSTIERLRSGLAIGLPSAVAGYAIAGPGGALAGALGGGGLGFTRSYLAHLTPAAKASEVVNNAALNLAVTLERAGDDPAEMTRYIKALSGTPEEATGIIEELGMPGIRSVDGEAVLKALQDAGSIADDLQANWEATRWHNAQLENIAKVTGKAPEKVLQEISNSRDAEVLLRQYVEVARRSEDPEALEIVRAYESGELQPQNLRDFLKVFTGEDPAPRTIDEYRGQLYAALGERMSQWAARYFDVKPDPAWARLGNTIKAAQSLVLLGLNPTYLINNFLNNTVTLAASGVFGLRSVESNIQFWERVGVTPPRLKAGVGPAALGIDFDYQAIRDAATKPGMLNDVQKFFTNKDGVGKVQIFSNLSGDVEQWSSANASTQGFKQAWSKLHNPKLPLPLEQALSAVHPELPRLVLGAVKGGLNQAEIETALWSGFSRRTVDAGIPTAAEALGLNESEVRSILQETGLYDNLSELLSRAGDDEAVYRAFREIDRQFEGWLNEQTRQSLAARVSTVAARVKTDGLAGVVAEYSNVMLDLSEFWTQHFMDWQNAFDEAEANPTRKQTIIVEQRTKAQQAWSRKWKQMQSSYLGIAEGLGFDTPTGKSIVENVIAQEGNWALFFELKNKKIDQFFNTIFTSRERRAAAWRDLQFELLDLYQDHHVKEIELQQLLDTTFVDAVRQQFGADVAQAAEVWRGRMLNFHKERGGLMQRFRLYAASLDYKERNAAWTQFLNQGIPGLVEPGYLPFLRGYFQGEVDGAYSLYAPRVPEMQVPGGGNGQGPAGGPRQGTGMPPETPDQPQIRVATAQVDRARVQELMDAGMTQKDAISQALNEQRPPTIEPAPQAARTAQVREIAYQYGISSADDAGQIRPGADRYILNIVRKWGGQEAKGYVTIEDVDPQIAEKAFKLRDLAKEAQLTLPDERNAGLMGPRNALDQHMTPRAAEEISRAIASEERMMEDELSGAGVEFIEVEEGQYIRASSNPEWYKRLYAEHKVNRKAVESALRRIIEDKGKDKIKANETTIELVKDVLLARLMGDEQTMQPPHPGILLFAGREEDAARALGSWLDSEWARNATDEDWMQLLGTETAEETQQVLGSLFDEWSRLVEEETGEPGYAPGQQLSEREIQDHVIDWQKATEYHAEQPEERPVQEIAALGDAPGAADELLVSPPVDEILEQGWRDQVRPILRALQDSLTGPDAVMPEGVRDLNVALDPDTLKALRLWLSQVYGEMGQTKLAAIKWGENRRDAALLNYNRRYGFDHVLSFFFPYQFWYTRSAFQWALRAIDRPSYLATWARLRQMQRNLIYAPGFPTRLQNKMKIPMPFLPDWAGDGVYIDPLKQLFPFEQFARPLEQLAKDKTNLERRAEYVLFSMLESEEITEEEAQQALEAHAGELWDRAMTQAQIEFETETSNPFDFVGLMLGWSLPLSWGYNLATGRKEKISQLPVTRMVRSISSLMGANQGRGVNLEGPLRRALDIPELDQFEDYRIDRMLANLAAEGRYATDELIQAMFEKSGPAYAEAARRVAQQGGLNYWGAPIGADLFPEGEQKQRALQLEYDKAREAWLNGDGQAFQKFFDQYPEYQVRQLLSKWNDPEERLRLFLRSEIWNQYMALPDLHQRQLREELGEVFELNFLNKETRAYDTIDTATLALWAKTMGGYVPSTAPESPQITFDLAPDEEAMAYQQYIDERNQLFPGINSLQNLYYALPESMQRDWLKRNPKLKEYWTWRNAFLAENPTVIPFVTGENSRIAGATPEIQELYYQYRAEKDRRYPDIEELQSEYFGLPSKAAAAAFRAKHPELMAYWDWQESVMAEFPELINYIKSPQSLARQLGLTDQQGGQFSPAEAIASEVSLNNPLSRQLTGYYYASESLGAGSRKALRRIWEKNGRPGTDLNDFIDNYLRPVITGKN